MTNPPTGTVTFLFTDIEGSTTRWEHFPQAMEVALGRHDAILRAAIEANGGFVFRTEGDAFRAAFPDLGFEGTADLIAEGDYVVGQWIGGGTQTGDAFDDLPIGSLTAGTGKAMRFTGVTILKVENRLITEELGLDDGVTALQQLGLITAA